MISAATVSNPSNLVSFKPPTGKLRGTLAPVAPTIPTPLEGDSKKMELVLEKFQRYCEPRKNIPFERYRFNRRCQEPGKSYDQYRTALRQLVENCDFTGITPDELLHDQLVFDIRDAKTRERLLQEPALTLARTDEVCRAAESTLSQLKLVEDSTTNVSVVNTTPKVPECPNCGRTHEDKTAMSSIREDMLKMPEMEPLCHQVL